MAPKGKAALAKRQKARADLKGQDIIWIGIAASEMNIQRIGALLMLADWPIEVETLNEDQLAGVIPIGECPPMEVDYELVKRTIAGHLAKYLELHGEAKTRGVLQSFGGERLALVPQYALLDLERVLRERLDPKK